MYVSKYWLCGVLISLACLETGHFLPLPALSFPYQCSKSVTTPGPQHALLSPKETKFLRCCFLSTTILSLCYDSCFKRVLFTRPAAPGTFASFEIRVSFVKSPCSCFLFLEWETAYRSGRLAKTKPPFLFEAASPVSSGPLLTKGMITWRCNFPLNGLISWENTRYIEFELC